MKLVTLIQDAQYILMESGSGVHITVEELQDWVNAAYKEIVNLRPDVSAKADTFACVAGTRQNLSTDFPTAIRLLDVVRNVAAASKGRSVRAATRQSLDSSRPGWINATEAIDIVHFVYDDRVPREFLTYPPAAVGAQLEVIYADPLAEHALDAGQLVDPTTADLLSVADPFANAVLDYVLYRAFSKDTSNPTYAARATAHYQAAIQSITGKSSTDASESPNAARQG